MARFEDIKVPRPGVWFWDPVPGPAEGVYALTSPAGEVVGHFWPHVPPDDMPTAMYGLLAALADCLQLEHDTAVAEAKGVAG